MKRRLRTAILVTFSTLVTAPALMAQKPLWPELPKTYVNGRPATEQDLKAGRAVFMPLPEDQSGQAASVHVPQYALWKDSTGKQHRTVVIQAEKNKDGSEVLALKLDNGEIDIVDAPEVRLLGENKPRE